MATATFSSRIFGLVREQVMAHLFGASGVTDAFLVAYRIPNMLRDLFAEGIFSSAFVPTFTKVRQQSEDEAKSLFWSLFILLGGITFIIGALILIFAEGIVGFVAPEFAHDPEKLHLTVVMIRWMSPFLLLVSLAALFMGALNSLKVFFISSFAPVFYNLFHITAMLVIAPILTSMGYHAAISMAMGVLGGGTLQLLVQVPSLFKRGYSFRGPISLINEHTRAIAHRFGIGTIGVAAQQINILINTMIATSSGVGAVSWLTYGFRIFQFPVGILGVSIGGSNLVHFSEAWKKGERETAVGYLQTSYYLSLLTILPTVAFIMALSIPTMNLIFERGAFTHQDTLMSALALRAYAIGLPFYAVYKIFAPTFYSIDRPGIPVLISIGSIIVNVVISIFLTPIYGFWILALATSVSMLINVFVEAIYLRKHLKLSLSFFVNRKVSKYVGASLFLYLALLNLSPYLFTLEAPFLSRVTGYAAITLTGALFYLFSLLLFGELSFLKEKVKKLFSRG